MKIIVSETKKDDEIVFPCLMINKNQPLIILVDNMREGDYYATVISAIHKDDIGKHQRFSPTVYEKFTGSITLEND